jgi:DNA adenine methylase
LTNANSSKRLATGTPPVAGRPLLKWAGGKRSLVDRVLALVPPSYEKYYEPFVGGAALFFALAPAQSILSDKNIELINCYRQVRNNPVAVFKSLRRLSNDETTYYTVRASRPRSKVGRAARLIYLTTLSFNGIYRLNLNGEFNVPYGYKVHVEPANEQKLAAASAILQKARLRSMDFQSAVRDARAGDLIYFDPPYTVAHSNNGFVKYNSKIFSWNDQVRLARVARTLADKGCTVIVSNAWHESIDTLYSDFGRLEIERASVMAASSAFRRTIKESIFYAGTKNAR